MIDPEVRRLGIGGSEVGAIFGVDEMRDAFSVWAQKKSDLPQFPPTERMLIGSALEPGVLTLYTHVTGREVAYHNRTLQHPTRPWMVYTPDALCVHERRGVDAKVVSWDQRGKWGETADDIPQRIQLQCWWYMSGFDYDVWDVAALLGDGLPRIYTIHRDMEAERVMLARVEEFHRRYIAGDEMPDMGSSESARVWLQQAFPHHKRPDLRTASEAELNLIHEYIALRTERKILKRRQDEVGYSITHAIAEREGLVWFGGKFTWRKTKDREVTDWEALARGLLNGQDEDTRATLLGLHTRTLPGQRRIWCSSLPAETAEEAA